MEDENFTPLWPDEKQLHMAIQKSLQDQEGKDLSTLEAIDPHKRQRESNLYVYHPKGGGEGEGGITTCAHGA